MRESYIATSEKIEVISDSIFEMIRGRRGTIRKSIDRNVIIQKNIDILLEAQRFIVDQDDLERNQRTVEHLILQIECPIF